MEGFWTSYGSGSCLSKLLRSLDFKVFQAFPANAATFVRALIHLAYISH